MENVHEQKTEANQKGSGFENFLIPPSRYQELLHVPKSDSFKNSFRLKLHGADPIISSTWKTGENSSSKCQDMGDQEQATYLSVLIPAKTEIKPHAREILNQFHKALGEKPYQEIFDKMMANASYLTEPQKSRLKFLMDQNYRDLNELLYEYQKDGLSDSVQNKIREMAEIDQDNVTIVSSPTQKRRLATFETFEMILTKLKAEGFIAEKLFNTLIYLFLEEDVSVLSCFEVYLYNHDQREFLDTLFLIEKVHFFRNQPKQAESVAEFNDIMQDQLKIIYSLRKYLPFQTRITLEKIIRLGNNSTADMYKEFMKGRVAKMEFIHKLIEFAESKEEIISKYEQNLSAKKQISDSKNEKYKDYLMNCLQSKLLSGVTQLDRIFQMIDDNDKIIRGIFETWETTKDMRDFIENVQILNSMLQKKAFLDLILSKKQDLELSGPEIEKLRQVIRRPKNIIEACYQVYLKNSDEDDFLDTIKLIVDSFTNYCA